MHVRGIPDADRARAHVPLEVRERLLAELVAAVETVHDLQGTVRLELLDARRHPAHEGPRLLRVAEAHQAVEGKGGVADPGVSVVPVALAADRLGQPERGSGDDRAVLARSEELQRERRAVHRLTPATTVGAAADPAPPEVHGPLEGIALVVRLGRG